MISRIEYLFKIAAPTQRPIIPCCTIVNRTVIVAKPRYLMAENQQNKTCPGKPGRITIAVTYTYQDIPKLTGPSRRNHIAGRSRSGLVLGLSPLTSQSWHQKDTKECLLQTQCESFVSPCTSR